jgi:hypothetical protein
MGRRCEVSAINESDNDTQCELAAWELLKEAREERDKALARLRSIANMPEHDQDDAHRLRDMARRFFVRGKEEVEHD